MILEVLPSPVIKCEAYISTQRLGIGLSNPFLAFFIINNGVFHAVNLTNIKKITSGYWTESFGNAHIIYGIKFSNLGF